MKTRFSSIVQVKEQKLKDIEAKLSKARGELNKAKEDIAIIKEQIDTFQLPQKGPISFLQMASENLSSLHGVKKHKESIAQICENRVQQMQGAYKHAYIDLEKMKHLHHVEVAKEIKRLQDLEQKELDEMSVALFNLDLK